MHMFKSVQQKGAIHNMMTEWEAIGKRVSCRAYQEVQPGEEILRALAEKVDELNAASGLHMQLITADGTEIPLLKLSAAMFSGPVYTYAALVGQDSEEGSEKIGYYGEKLVLLATRLGLGTCWVAGTYDQKSVRAKVGEGEKLWDVVPIGLPVEKVPVKQRMIRASIRARDRKLEQFVESETPFADLPEWVKRGVEAVKLGPSAVNQQPVNIVWQDGRITAKLWKSGHGLAHNDMGIAKCQFEAGAASCGVKGRWAFGDGAEFVTE